MARHGLFHDDRGGGSDMGLKAKNDAENTTATAVSLPSWARQGRIRFARWDGGALETAKGLLSGWYYMPHPLSVEATTNWYENGRSLELLLSAGINCIWVTFTNGFSLATELPQQKQLAAFISRCHEHGIKVIAYASMVNVFIADMRAQEPGCDEWLQRTIDGSTIPYGAARYAGEPTRLLACLNHPQWRRYLTERVRRVGEAGGDGVCYDNHWTDCRCDRCREKWQGFQQGYGREKLPWPDAREALALSPEEQARLICMHERFRLAEFEEIFSLTREIGRTYNPEFLVSANFNSGYCTFTLPPNNMISTEDGLEPGYVNGLLVQNVGLLRSLAGASAGWKPVVVEYGAERDMGSLSDTIESGGVGATRFVPMKPRKHQLSMAEAAAFGAALEITPEGLFLRDLYFKEPRAMENWGAISAYNDFFRTHEELYTGVTTATGILSLHGSGCRRFFGASYPQRLELLRELAARKLVFDVAFDRDVTLETLRLYKVLLLADVWVMDDALIECVRQFAAEGGAILATGLTGRYDEKFKKRGTCALDDIPGVQWMQEPSRKKHLADGVSGQTNVMDRYESSLEEDLDRTLVDKLAQKLAELAPAPVRVEAPPFVLHNLTRDPNGRLLVHLLNYDVGARPAVSLGPTGEAKAVELAEWFSPDADTAPISQEADGTVQVPGLERYGVARLTFGQG
jgi:hypothetical protein